MSTAPQPKNGDEPEYPRMQDGPMEDGRMQDRPMEDRRMQDRRMQDRRIWTPWRHAYVTGDRSRSRPGVPESLSAWPGDLHCVFCNMVAAVDYAIEHGMPSEQAEAAVWILERGQHGFLVLNAFPYNSGHVMAVPYAHQDSLAGLPLATAEELLRLTRRAERALRKAYQPQGINIGLNLGEPAGAGIAEHLHIHAVPRWSGDNNFMAVLAQTRTLPEMLEESWQRLRQALAADPLEQGTGENGPEQSNPGRQGLEENDDVTFAASRD